MYYDLNLRWPANPPLPGSSSSSHSGRGASSSSSASQQPPSKKLKGKQPPGTAATASDAPKRGAELLAPHERAELEQSTRMAIKLGYSTVAYNVVLPIGAFDISTVAELNPCYGAQPVFPELDTRRASSSSSSSGQRRALQLSRLTVLLDEYSVGGAKGNGAMFTSSNANLLAGYNLVSALPLDAAAFSQVCLSYSSPGPSSIDIIALDMATSARLPFQLKRSMVLKAIADGAVFEICYGVAMRLGDGSGSASGAATIGQMSGRPVPRDARRNVISGARELIRITNGKGIILSSEVRRCMELRGPLDLCNLGTILGFKPDQAKAAVSGNARLAVLRGHAHRQTYRGVIGNPQVLITSATAAPTQPTLRQEAEVETDEGASVVGEKRKRTIST